MSDLERALRGAFALHQVPPPGAAFEARMARAAGARRGLRTGPIVLAAFVAGAAAATLATGRDRGQETTAPLAATAPPRARPAGGQGSVAEVWQLVIRFSRSWSAREEPAPVEDERPPPLKPARERQRDRRSVEPRIDCGDDPLCPLVAPTAARLSVAVDGGPARISIDGQDAGTSPRLLELIPGRHRVTVRAEDGSTRTLTIDLRPGEKRTLKVTLPEPRR
jgi:hypothetical protein